MSEKLQSVIKKINLNEATFHNEKVDGISFINYFYGGNGTGKTTIARSFESKTGLEWNEGENPEDYEILVYNQKFINDNFNYPDELNAVFSMGAVNNEILDQIASKEEEKKTKLAIATGCDESIRSNTSKLVQLKTEFEETCWATGKEIRNAFDSCMTGKKQKATFADAILSTPEASEQNIEILKKQYDVAFDPNSQNYSLFSRADGQASYGNLPGNDLLDKSIVSSADSSFGRFMNQLHAADWVSAGHKHFSELTGGKCPYCQQTLPDDFEKKLEECFDQQYVEDTAAISLFVTTYSREMTAIVDKLNTNVINVMPSLDKSLLETYKTKVSNLSSKVEVNKQRLSSKLGEPSKIVSLEDTDSLLLEIGTIIDTINSQIKINNDAVADKARQKRLCNELVWKHLAHMLRSVVEKYKADKSAIDDEITNQRTKQIDANNAARSISKQILDLRSKIVNSATTIENINLLLKDSGFQGFSIREKSGEAGYYEVVRKGENQPAENLSEGERNFIAFLYFYELSKGSLSQENLKKKIIVIDDPVSSMDSNSLFIVSSIIREMVQDCYNNTDYLASGESSNIRQIFILTHNVYFHREITFDREKDWKGTSFFIIRKADNMSTVKLCIKPNPARRSDDMNYNPVQNSYAALWEDLNDLDSAIPVLDVIRRILDYYFLQICGHSGTTLRQKILIDNKDKFIDNSDPEHPDNTKLILASSMLKYIDTTRNITDGLNYVYECDDAQLYKDVFKLIFEAMGQEQHFAMMMKENPGVTSDEASV